MTLDESTPLSEHLREIEHWTTLAARTEAEDRERWRLELEDRDSTESVESRESYWVGVMRQQPYWMRQIHYESGPG